MKKNTAGLLPFENHLPEEVTFPLAVVRGKTQSHENRLLFSFGEREMADTDEDNA